MICKNCGSDDVIPSFTIPTFKCKQCGHVTRDLEYEKREANCKNFGEPSDIVGVAFAMKHCAICDYHKACVEAIQSSASTAREENA